MTRFLASVTSVAEAEVVMEHADIIDLKNPAEGALGALPHDVVKSIVARVGGRKPVSATVGDLPMDPALVSDAVRAMSNTGVDIVKVGFFGGEGRAACIEALVELAGKCKIVAVFFADQQPDFSILEHLASAGFYGVMLDTADKSAGSLRTHLPPQDLALFVAAARSKKLLTGLAGSLRQEDITPLMEAMPDYLGFRGALCRDRKRVASLEGMRVLAVANALRGCNTRGALSGLQLQS